MANAYRLLLHGCAAIAALALGLVAVLVSFEVVARNIGLGNSPWIVEVSEYSLPLATFLIAPWLLYRNEHVRLDVLLTALPRRVARWLERGADVLGVAICAVFVGYGTKAMLDSATQGAMVLKTLVFPEWWLYLPVPFCFTVLAFEFLRRLFSAGVVAGGARHA